MSDKAPPDDWATHKLFITTELQRQSTMLVNIENTLTQIRLEQAKGAAAVDRLTKLEERVEKHGAFIERAKVYVGVATAIGAAAGTVLGPVVAHFLGIR